jgi:outer membrane protein OmpA-like peptidoglycan-associated protein
MSSDGSTGLGLYDHGEGYAQLKALSCASPGNCTVGGTYDDSDGHEQAFVASDEDYTWGDAIEVPGTTTDGSDGDGNAYLGDDGGAEVDALSCPTADSCSAGGNFDEDRPAFVWNQGSAVTFRPTIPTTTTTTTPTTTTTMITATTTTTIMVAPKPRPRFLPVDVYFANDEAIITPRYQRELRTLAAELVEYGQSHLTITGYANELGTNQLNLPLSVRRANAVANFLRGILNSDNYTSITFTVTGDGVLKTYSNLALDRVAVVNS